MKPFLASVAFPRGQGRVDDWRGSRWQWGVAVVRSRPVPQATPELRFQSPLVAPDVRISRIRRSDKTSRLHPRHVVPKPAQAYEPEVPVKVLEWISPALASPDLVLEAQPPAQPHSRVVVDRPIRLGDGSYCEVVRPAT